ncbi:5' nucleotidase, NT5C type [Tepidibacillus marianensis]|uniref:5' nucleotidase, NT5C type n=1 Tax=Tepidibacillus marianensis TaxID=3131995 RepID=UPI0030CEB5B0
MDKEFTLGIDIDGTVTDPFTFIPHMNQYFNKSFSLEEITTYDITRIYGITEEEFEEWYNVHGASVYQTAPLAKDAKEILLQFQKKYRLIYITARSESFREPTMKWFEQNQIPFDRVVMTGNAYKCEYAVKYQIDLFLEDHYDAANTMAKKLQIPILLFNTPYNQGSLPVNVARIYSWKEAKEIIDTYVQQKRLR